MDSRIQEGPPGGEGPDQRSNGGGGSGPSCTFGLDTRRNCWSRCPPYAAAQALHYSIPLLRAWSPEKRPCARQPRDLRVSMESRTQISACLSTERFQSLALTAA